MGINSKETAWAMGFLESVEDGNSFLQASAIDAVMSEGINSGKIVDPPDYEDTESDDMDDIDDIDDIEMFL